MSKRVLVTGSAGTIGQAVIAELVQRGHSVRGLDVRQTPSVSIGDTGDKPGHGKGASCTSIVAAVNDPAAIQQAVAGDGGVDTIVHLAATVDEAPFMEHLLEPNVVGMYQVLHAARRHGVQRVVLASSIQVIGGLIYDTPQAPAQQVIGTDVSAPTNHYALTKLWTEQAGAMYARNQWIESVIAARIGWLPRTAQREQVMQNNSRRWLEYLSRDDARRFFAAAVAADHTGFDVLYATGAGSAPLVDLAPGKRLLGYTPRDHWPTGAIAQARWRAQM